MVVRNLVSKLQAGAKGELTVEVFRRMVKQKHDMERKEESEL